MKKCTGCGKEMGPNDYYKSTPGKCKICKHVDTKRNYLKTFEKRRERINSYSTARFKTEAGKLAARLNSKKMKEKYPEKYKAREIFKSAVRSGKITRLPCGVCGDFKVQGHHDDYSKPLEVRWLCNKHHRDHHRRITQGIFYAPLKEDLLSTLQAEVGE